MTRDVALDDQAAAAVRHAERIVRRVARNRGRPLVDATDHPAISRLGRELRGRFNLGMLRSCPHVTWPEPVVWRAWDPDIVLCPSCAVAISEPIAGTRADFECDACGAHDRRGQGCMAQYGPALILLFLCRSCQART